MGRPKHETADKDNQFHAVGNPALILESNKIATLAEAVFDDSQNNMAAVH